jgi:hypothetical protein
MIKFVSEEKKFASSQRHFPIVLKPLFLLIQSETASPESEFFYGKTAFKTDCQTMINL